MTNEENKKVERWHLRLGRAKFLRPGILIFMGCVYAFVYLAVAGMMFVLDWIVPHLPWIEKPYVSPDPPPLVTASYCANFILGMMIIGALVIYFAGPERQIKPLWPKKKI